MEDFGERIQRITQEEIARIIMLNQQIDEDIVPVLINQTIFRLLFDGIPQRRSGRPCSKKRKKRRV
jgi:hypothetical protein